MLPQIPHRAVGTIDKLNLTALNSILSCQPYKSSGLDHLFQCVAQTELSTTFLKPFGAASSTSIYSSAFGFRGED